MVLEGRHQRLQTDRQTVVQLGRGCRMFPAIGSWRREGVGWKLGNNTWKRRGGESRCLICRCKPGPRGQGCRRAWQLRRGSFSLCLKARLCLVLPRCLRFPGVCFLSLSAETPGSASLT